MPKPWENKSGCADPTAYAATQPLIEEEQRVPELVKVIKYIAKHAGFDIVNRIELRDRKTGRVYK